ncbi:hypothetical protein JCM18918_2312 [Cutibacterium acnes JCM 18918]|nr:hypothetical protein JCM18918_2312 [Cutibacterium acnes JCM 18918]
MEGSSIGTSTTLTRTWSVHDGDLSARVQWPAGEREELFGMSARASGPAVTDSRADIYVDGSREVAVWRYPDDLISRDFLARRTPNKWQPSSLTLTWLAPG